jgi:hypothetical protein
MHAFGSAGMHVVKVRIENNCDIVEMEIVVTVVVILRRTMLSLVVR